jgi:type IV pilus assembly protein PilX
MNANFHCRQRGAVLIVALIFLVILTMLGVTAMTGTTMETRMAGNARDLGVALQAAEAGLRDGHMDIENVIYAGGARRTPAMAPNDFGVGGAFGTCNNGVQTIGLCRPRFDPQGPSTLPAAQVPQDLVPLGISLTASPSVEYGTFTGAGKLKGVAIQPHYLIEAFCLLVKPDGSMGEKAGPPCKYYRITSRGYGGNPNSQVTLNEVYTLP